MGGSGRSSARTGRSEGDGAPTGIGGNPSETVIAVTAGGGSNAESGSKGGNSNDHGHRVIVKTFVNYTKGPKTLIRTGSKELRSTRSTS